MRALTEQEIAREQITADDVVPDHCPGWQPCHYCPGMIHHGQDYIEIACPTAGLVYAHHACYLDVEAGRRAGCGGGA